MRRLGRARQIADGLKAGRPDASGTNFDGNLARGGVPLAAAREDFWKVPTPVNARFVQDTFIALGVEAKWRAPAERPKSR